MRAMGESVPLKGGSIIYEDPDQLGYKLITRGTPVATEETQRILCEIMPAQEWEEIEHKAVYTID